MGKRVTIKDIARELGTNSSTVSRALNDSPLISQKTKTLVQQKAREMGYLADPVARQLREGRSRTIGMIVPMINRTFFANVIHGVEAVAKANGFQLLICQSNNVGEEEQIAVQTFRAQRVAGVIVSQATEPGSEEAYQQLLTDRIPVIMFDRVSDTLPISKVVNANTQASYEAVSHLIEQGYRKIAYFAGPRTLTMYEERLEGYRRALSEAGIPEDPNLIFPNVLTKEEGKAITHSLLDQQVEFDAIASSSDFSALGAWEAFSEAGIQMPDQKGLIGFANEPFTAMIGMSSVEQYSVDMGKTVGELLIEQITTSGTDESSSPQEVIINSQVIRRSSSTRKAAD